MALVTPVLKKGDSTQKENFRPVSCLPAASKLLEMVVNEQTSEFLEKNNLLPNNQHGFRPMRSTMTAWSNIQKQWAQNTDEKQLTGVLLWDLSAAFDCLVILTIFHYKSIKLLTKFENKLIIIIIIIAKLFLLCQICGFMCNNKSINNRRS